MIINKQNVSMKTDNILNGLFCQFIDHISAFCYRITAITLSHDIFVSDEVRGWHKEADDQTVTV